MTSDRRFGRAIDAAMLIAAAVLLAVVGHAFVRAAFEFPYSRDAAHWVPHARQVAGGMTPFVDFDPSYAPGPFYLMAILGADGLRSPALVKGYFYAFHLLNGCLLYSVLRRLAHAAPASALLAACYLAWICACDGFAVEVEPMQVSFALGAAWLLAVPCSARAVAAAGALAGASLMMKQYSLLFVPPLALAAFGSRPPVADATPAAHLRRRSWTRLALFLGAVPAAFALFALLTWQNPVRPLVALVTYGGNRYPADGLRAMVAMLATGRAARPLLVAGALAAATLAWRRTPRAAVIGLGLVLSVAPLCVRSYEHYVQLAAPWAIVAVAEFASACGGRIPPARRTAAVVVAICLVGWADAVANGLRDAHRRMTRAPIASQIAIARTVESAVGDPEDVLMINVEWVYALSDIRQPLPRRDLRYGEPLEGMQDQRDAARCAVVGPGFVPIPEAVAWLEAGGFRQRSTIDPALPLLYFDRAKN